MNNQIDPDTDAQIGEKLKTASDEILYKAMCHAEPSIVLALNWALSAGKTPRQIAQDTKAAFGSTNYARMMGRIARHIKKMRKAKGE